MNIVIADGPTSCKQRIYCEPVCSLFSSYTAYQNNDQQTEIGYKQAALGRHSRLKALYYVQIVVRMLVCMNTVEMRLHVNKK